MIGLLLTGLLAGFAVGGCTGSSSASPSSVPDASPPLGVHSPSPSLPAPAPVRMTAFDRRGSGGTTTRQFMVAAAWSLQYSYDCARSPVPGFNINIYRNGHIDLGTPGVTGLSVRGHGLTHGFGSGHMYLMVGTGCRWHVKVTTVRPVTS